MQCADAAQRGERVVQPVLLHGDPQPRRKARQATGGSEVQVLALLVVVAHAELQHAAQGELSADGEGAEALAEGVGRLVQLMDSNSHISPSGFCISTST